MTDLTTAMREAVAEAEHDRQLRRAHRAGTDRLPGKHPEHRIMSMSLVDLVRAQSRHGDALAAALQVGREAVTLTLLFWVSIMVVALGENGGQITLPLLGTVSTPGAAVLAALLLRGIFLALSRVDERAFR